MAVTLSEYLVYVQRLLNDTSAKYWTQQEIVDYINEARKKVAVDTACVRSFQTGTLIAGTEKYLFSSLLSNGSNTVDVLNVTLLWGGTRVPLNWFPFTTFNAYLRTWQSYRTTPVAFTIYGANILWIGPVPSQAFGIECDTAVLPDDLVQTTDPDLSLPIPYTDAVKYYAARLAKLQMQATEEASFYENLYVKRINELNAMYPRRIPNVYETED